MVKRVHSGQKTSRALGHNGPHAAQGTPSLPELKLLYYGLLIRYHEHSNGYVDICRCYKAIYEARCHAPSCSPVFNARGSSSHLPLPLGHSGTVERLQEPCESLPMDAVLLAGAPEKSARLKHGAGPCAQTPSVSEDAAKWAPVLKKICWYCVLAPHGSDQVRGLPRRAHPLPWHAA